MEWIEKKYSQFVQKWCMSSKYKKSCIFISVYTILFLFSFVLAFSPFLLEKSLLFGKVMAVPNIIKH